MRVKASRKVKMPASQHCQPQLFKHHESASTIHEVYLNTKNCVYFSLDTVSFVHILCMFWNISATKVARNLLSLRKLRSSIKNLDAAMDIQTINTKHCSICRKITKASNTATSALCWPITHREAGSYLVPSYCLAKDIRFCVSHRVKSHNPTWGNSGKFTESDKTFHVLDWKNLVQCYRQRWYAHWQYYFLETDSKIEQWNYITVLLMTDVLSGWDWKMDGTIVSELPVLNFVYSQWLKPLRFQHFTLMGPLLNILEEKSVFPLYCKKDFYINVLTF